MKRRELLTAAATLICASRLRGAAHLDLKATERPRVLAAGAKYLNDKPLTVTAAQSKRSAGGLHDFFSEGDYWWPDPKNPDGPYLQRDGMSNPDNFVEHRRALMGLSVRMPALTAAWLLTHDKKYSTRAGDHLRAWFVDEKTRMSPNLQFAQAIHGRTTGRGTGVIDTVHLVEVAQAIPFIGESGAISAGDLAAVKRWFSDYAEWMATSKNGIEERDTKNNHATCWGMQLAAFARLTGNQEQMDWVRNRYRTVYVPNQMAADGSFPLELARTKPYGYSLFNLDALTTICQLLDLWQFRTEDGRGAEKAVQWMSPFIADKSKWTRTPDVMYFNEWPMRHSSLLFAGLAFDKPEWIGTWQKLRADSDVEEVVRNFFVRQPLLWVRA